MNNLDQIQKIEHVLVHLRALKKDLVKVDKLSEKAFNSSSSGATPRQIQKASTDLNWACMELDKQRRRTWKAINDAELEVDLTKRDYNPSGFHRYTCEK